MKGVARFVALAAMVLTCSSGVTVLAQCMEQQKLTTTDGAEWDFFGSSVSVSGDTAIVGAPRDDCIDKPSACCFESELPGCGDPNIEACVCAQRPSCCESRWDNICVDYVDRFGCGTCGFDCGAAYIYRYDGFEWIEEQRLTGFDVTTNDHFGRSVSISENTAVVGAGWNACPTGVWGDCGTAYVFRFNGTSWIEEQQLISPGWWWLDNFGNSVSVSGNSVLVGASWDDCATGDWHCGSAYVFRYNGAQWDTEQRLTADDQRSADEFGISVSINGETAMVLGGGSAYMFRPFNVTSWVQQQKLTTSDALTGESFLESISVEGHTAVVGRHADNCGEDHNCCYATNDPGCSDPGIEACVCANRPYCCDSSWQISCVFGLEDFGCGTCEFSCGSVYVYRFDGISWVEQQKLIASDLSRGDFFGTSVSLSGDTIVVGSVGPSWDDNVLGPRRIGSAYVFRFNGTFWVENLKLTASDAIARNWFGKSVSVSGDTVVVGALYDPCAAGFNCGAAYVFDLADISGLGPADPDCDGDVDLEDLASFQVNFMGDLFDFASVLVELTGPQ